MNKDDLIEDCQKEKVTAAATEAIAGALPGMLNAAMPQMPTSTGGVVPKTDTSPAVLQLSLHSHEYL